jgi:hypothetical protein
MQMAPQGLMKSVASQLIEGHNGDVLTLSMRRLETIVGYSPTYEFGDVVREVTDADCVEVGDRQALEFSRRAYKLARLTTRSAGLARAVAPKPSVVRLKRDYKLFLPIFNHPYELYALASVPEWRSRCSLAACWINEVWVHLLPEYLLELLAQFDQVFLGTGNSVNEVGRMVGRPCSQLPMAADVLRFSSWPNPPVRSIDVCNIGRRSEITHAALVKLAAERKIGYYYDTITQQGVNAKQRIFHVKDHREHRLLLAQILQRSRYYVTHRSRINEPEYTGGNEEFSGRFFEGAAAGVIMIGQPPASPMFRTMFDWEDAVIPMPFDCPEIGLTLAELDRDTQRLAAIPARNISNAARRHDWLHRLKIVYSRFSLPATPGMNDREQRLVALSKFTQS